MSQIALNSALSALQIATKRIEVLANDIANKNTTGYKMRDVRSTDLMYSSVRAGNAEALPSQTQVGHGARVTCIARLVGQGPMKQTGAPLDLMINGSGYFAVTLPDGRKAYTRDGSFSLNSESTLVTKSGETVDGEIKVSGDPQKVTVDTNGNIKGEEGESYNIKIFTFPNEQGLEAISNNLFLETEASGSAQELTPGENGSGQIQQGAVEGSNVEVAKAMSDLMDAGSVYELAIRILEAINKIEHKSAEIMRV
jgi:flagellar basal-body rod protein FlgG